MTIREAFASGKPVVGISYGSKNAEIIKRWQNGLLFEPGKPDDLAEKVRWLAEHKEIAIQMGKSAREEFEASITAEKNYEILIDIYKIAIKKHNEKNAK